MSNRNGNDDGIGALFIVIGGSIAGLFVLSLIFFQMDRFFAPREVAVDRAIYEETELHIDGIKNKINKQLYRYCNNSGETQTAAKNEILRLAGEVSSRDRLGDKGAFIRDAVDALENGSFNNCDGVAPPLGA